MRLAYPVSLGLGDAFYLLGTNILHSGRLLFSTLFNLGCSQSPVSPRRNLLVSSRSLLPVPLLLVSGAPNAARFITIMTSAKRYSPMVNPMAACIAKIPPSQIQRVLFGQMKTG